MRKAFASLMLIVGLLLAAVGAPVGQMAEARVPAGSDAAMMADCHEAMQTNSQTGDSKRTAKQDMADCHGSAFSCFAKCAGAALPSTSAALNFAATASRAPEPLTLTLSTTVAPPTQPPRL